MNRMCSNLKPLYVIGAGGFGRETVWLTERINAVSPVWEVKGFIDDDISLHGKELDGYRVIGGCSSLTQLSEDFWVVCAVGCTKIRKKIIDRIIGIPFLHFATLTDPDAKISRTVSIGEGCIICAGNILTTDISIGKHVIINLDCTIGHDVILKEFVTLYPGVHVSGNVVIGNRTEIGTGTQIIQGKQVGDGAIVGAGTVVVKDIPSYCTVVGNPAKVIKLHEKHQENDLRP